MFVPPRCPYRGCPRHLDPRPRFYWLHGSYRPKCRPQPVPRFLCKSCRRSFSRQTFRADYRDHRPHLNAPLFQLLTSGVGLRQCARLLDLSLHCTELKFRKLARHLANLNLNLRRPLEGVADLQFDEFETYEGCRNTRPLTVPMLIERESRYVIWAESAPIRPRGRMTAKRRERIARQEAESGPRKDESRRAIRRTFAKGAALVRGCEEVVLSTDEKKNYPGFAREAFGAERLLHNRVSSKQVRREWNPLFPINHSEAMVRDLSGRLRRESWLASKQGWCLDLHLQVYMAYRNLVRRRFNQDSFSPAQSLRFVERRLEPTECLSWRQEWGPLSPHPLGDGRRLVTRAADAA